MDYIFVKYWHIIVTSKYFMARCGYGIVFAKNMICNLRYIFEISHNVKAKQQMTINILLSETIVFILSETIPYMLYYTILLNLPNARKI